MHEEILHYQLIPATFSVISECECDIQNLKWFHGL